MKPIFFAVVIMVTVVSCGCVQSPATVAKEMPGFWENTTKEVNTAIESRATFSPLVTSDAYVPPPTQQTQQKLASIAQDPIVGSWKYSGTSYQCDATFAPDNTGFASCSMVGFQVRSKKFNWVPAVSSYSWMRNYTLTEANSDNKYSVLYSERNGGITSDIIPDGGYLVKVN
jgi:hypothetical protein